MREADMTLSGQKIVVVGGCGHVGLPLGVKFALAGAETKLIDVDAEKVNIVNSGKFPFVEKDGDEQLGRAIQAGLRATTNPADCANADCIIFVTGTPVDEHLNPKLSEVLKIVDSYQPHFKPGMLVVMRSTLFPGTMSHISERMKRSGHKTLLSFCPERVSQGYALDEIDSLPQIVSAFDDESFQAARALFAAIAPKIIRLTPIEAEMTKLMANAWRYLEFAIANQFYVIAETNGVDFARVYEAIRHDYPRAKGYKAPGFAAGPCLFKDTMQLACYFNNQFYLGHSAMLVNEGLTTVVVDKALQKLSKEPWESTIGLLGMTFKAENDDIRESLSFRVKKGLEFHGVRVLWHDPYLPESESLDTMRQQCDALILCTPHKEYHSLKFLQPVIDVWGVFAKPVLETYPGTAASGVEKLKEKRRG